MQVSIKTFDELSIHELYQILRLRSEVFVVEQDCVYQDVDNKDQKALHIMGMKNGQVVAYTRVFKPGDYFDNVSIGRVVVRQDQRKYGLGKQIMLATMAAIDQRFPNKPIEISAQSYLLKFYTDLGFSAFGEEYLEDGIPHRRMLKK
ncbi:MAG: GNAT family N-acetyltransferase [Muricauda sp.]|nr:GNAT family N-acetyltransferase [Allomuricauda sp.]MBO6532590.1 GNAT family N-acetyltransferase [Allomuricauda sp.]MBO6587977.1 GNAT family N-acetyltransferase [Allomuricauda sp.]MBO6617602.1 GNAT family N-acetyltransferase [Allomuricauda sp.]MBO6643387.1 GNAT family N-acetyltransferase [Allomuricauda sp.]MBO6745937.1 GNAT family N-acetyltransferase [Allomuricauda sp.]